MLPDPSAAALDPADLLELARLEQLVRAVPLPSPELPGWQSLTAQEYEVAARHLADLLGTIVAALSAARAAG